jgi:hypothetical protein
VRSRDATLSIVGVGAWVAFVTALVTSETNLLTGPTEPLLNPTTVGNALILLTLGLGLVSTVFVLSQILRLGRAKIPVLLAFAGSILFCALLLLAALRYVVYST